MTGAPVAAASPLVPRRLLLLCGACGAALVPIALAVAVDCGRLAHFDQYSVSHLMPWLGPTTKRTTLAHLVVPEARHTLGGTLVALLVYPASFLVSGAIVLACALALARRDRWTPAVALCAGWLAVGAVEAAGKRLVTRPTLRETSWGSHGYLPGFDHSLPSGHTMRALVVAAAVAAAARGGRLAYLWALSVPVALVAIGDHTVTDVDAGLGAGIAVVAVCAAASTTSARRTPRSGRPCAR
jgi:membrane-associated phospholipid phosphatase